MAFGHDGTSERWGGHYSWIELATSWMFYQQQYLPVKRPSCDGKYVVIAPEGFDAAKDLGVTLSELFISVSLTERSSSGASGHYS